MSNLRWGAAMVVVLLVAAWFRTYRLDTVPPGPHFDAVINGQIVDELILPALPPVMPEGGGNTWYSGAWGWRSLLRSCH